MTAPAQAGDGCLPRRQDTILLVWWPLNWIWNGATAHGALGVSKKGIFAAIADAIDLPVAVPAAIQLPKKPIASHRSRRTWEALKAGRAKTLRISCTGHHPRPKVDRKE